MKTKSFFKVLTFSLSAAIMFCSCGGNSPENKTENTETATTKSSGKKFAPKEKESTMTDSERKAAIEAKKMEMSGMDSLVILGTGIKLAVMTPMPDAENYVTDRMSQELGMRMLNVASQNGVSGIGGDPTFVLLAGVTGADKKLTGTAPQKTMITYDLTLYVGNIVSGDVFGSSQIKLVGVGNDKEQAAVNAAKELTNSSEIQNMLKTSGNKIVKYYNDHASQIQADIEGKIGKGDYASAYGLLRSVPEEARTLFTWAAQKLPAVAQQLTKQENAATMSKLKAAIAAGDEEYNPEISDLLAMIPANSDEYKAAHDAYNDYVTRLRKRTDDKVAFDREQEKIALELAHKEKTQQMEMEVAMAKATSSSEMRKKIALEDAAGSPFKMLWLKAGYAINSLFSK